MGKLFDALWDTRESLRKRGLAATIRAARRRLSLLRVPTHPFDIAYGTDTGGLIGTAKGDHPNSEHGRDYWGTPPSMLRGGLARWSATLEGTGYTTADYTFIDLGCGKGRALMVASEFPFTSVLGVELNEALVTVARKNLAIWSQNPHSSESLRVLHDDALAFPFPETPVLLYLFNPFDAVVVGLLADRIAGLLTRRQHPVDIMYARPEHVEPFEALPGVQILWKGEVPFTQEDSAADIFDTVQQQVFLYRVCPPNRLS